MRLYFETSPKEFRARWHTRRTWSRFNVVESQHRQPGVLRDADRIAAIVLPTLASYHRPPTTHFPHAQNRQNLHHALWYSTWASPSLTSQHRLHHRGMVSSHQIEDFCSYWFGIWAVESISSYEYLPKCKFWLDGFGLHPDSRLPTPTYPTMTNDPTHTWENSKRPISSSPKIELGSSMKPTMDLLSHESTSKVYTTQPSTWRNTWTQPKNRNNPTQANPTQSTWYLSETPTQTPSMHRKCELTTYE